jgi:two-component system, OmpR family, sensor kinase
MDGLKRQLNDSLQVKLAVWLATVICAIAVAAGLISFATAFQEANELQDQQLRQIATLVSHHHLPVTVNEMQIAATESDPESLIVLQMLSEPDGKVLPRHAFPPSLEDGIQTVLVADQTWRVVVKTLENGARVAIGQKTSARDEIARNGALRTLLPFVILIPLLLVLVGALIRQMLKPVKELAHELNARSDDDLRALNSEGVPAEIRPFVLSINRLLERVTQSMTLQRRFLADAAHELRTPLTALSLQSESLATSPMSDQAKKRLSLLREGLGRSRQLLDQLLAMARAQEATLVALAAVSVHDVCHRVVEDLMPLAESKQIDLGSVGTLDTTVLATEIDLFTLVRNLVDNAVRYTPCGGTVDIQAWSAEKWAFILIEDSGLGIPVEERERVFDPFYRVLGSETSGSGLGLSIVKATANRIGASIDLDYVNAKQKTGLRVTVRLLQAR